MGLFSFWQLLGYSRKARVEKTQNRVIQIQAVIGYYYSSMTICYGKYRQNCSGFYQGVYVSIPLYYIMYMYYSVAILMR